jgi:hypothetical protein
MNVNKFLRRVFGKIGKTFIGRLYEDLKIDIHHRSSKEAQLMLFHAYKEMASRGIVPSLLDVGFRCHSQCEEDGILLFIFALIGTTNKKVVEICAGDGIECMSANLILNHGWWGYLFDGNKENVKRGQMFFRNNRDTFLCPPKFTHAWINAENVNTAIGDAGLSGEIDLLALDIDGMDYWVWKAIRCIRPRVVVCETHNAIGADEALTVPYGPNFVITKPDFCGASLAAMTKLAEEKGYRLIGTHRYGFNAFFILKEIAKDILPTVAVEQCLKDPFSLEARSVRWPKVKNMNWVKV